MNSILSGLVAAIVSGVINLMGYFMTTHVQSKNNEEAIKMQKEIAEMQKDQKLFYESQLEWANATRKEIAEFVDNCFKFNILVKDIQKVSQQANQSSGQTLNEKENLMAKNADNMKRARDLISTLNKEVTMVRLYLFHKDNDQEKKVLDSILTIETSMDVTSGIDSKLLNRFVDVVRDYFDHQMKELKKKSA